MPDRATAIAAFLAAAGWVDAYRRDLAGDASFRRYERLALNGRRAVLMDAPPAHEDIRPFIAIAGILRGHGYSAPRVLASDPATGLALIEDLGDDLYTRVLAAGGDEATLYGAAVDLLLDLHTRPPPEPAPPPYDAALFKAEADLFVDWFLPAAAGAPPPVSVRAAWDAAWDTVLPRALAPPNALVLRDYHAENLIWLPARRGLARVGLLDFQDAVIGPIAYDLVSLIEDARRDLEPLVAAAMIHRYVSHVPGLDGDAFAAAYAVLGAQRNCKIIGIFTRLWRRDGKARYLDHLPRVWGHLATDLAHPALAPVKRWFDDHVSPAWRGRPRECPEGAPA